MTGEIVDCIREVRGRTPGIVHRRNSARVIGIQSYWIRWPCLIPQHGPGYKHTRQIRLACWQAAMVEAAPWPFIRGLIHSDGCRVVNRVTAKGRVYTYPRYFFANESTDILAIVG